jgi:hypothetical protein
MKAPRCANEKPIRWWYRLYHHRQFTASNETEMRCGGREGASPAVREYYSSQKLIAGLLAACHVSFFTCVGSSAWLDFFVESRFV